EERYRSVVNDQAEMICRFRPDGIITFVNEAYRTYFAPLLGLDDLPGRSVRDIMQVKNYAEVDQFLSSLTLAQPIRQMERQFPGRDGKVHWQVWSVRALFGSSGTKPSEFQVVGHDITDRKRMEEELRRKNEELNASYEQITAAEEELRAQLEEIVQKQHALRISEERFRAFTENIPDLTTISDRSGKYTYVSPSLLHLTGRDLKEVIGKEALGEGSALGIVNEDLGMLHSVADQAYAHPGQSIRIPPFRGHDHTGREIYLDGTVTYLPDVEGIRGIIFHGRDITERIRTEMALGEGEKSFRAIFEASPFPAAINSVPDYRFVAVNRAFVEVSGFSKEEAIGKTHLGLGIISTMEAAKLIARFAIAGKLENQPLALKGRDGKEIQVIFSTVPITFEGRQAVLTMTAEVTQLRLFEKEIFQKNEELNAAMQRISEAESELHKNYSELQKNEQAIRASEIKFRALVQNTLDGILIIDFSGNIHFVNRAVGDIVEIDDEAEIVGKRNVMEFVAPESREEVMKDFRTVAGGTDSYIAQYKLITDKKREIWIESIGKKIPYGTNDAILLSIRDVTGRKEAEEELRESERKFASVFRNNPVALTLVSATDGRFIDVNEAFLHNTGYSRDEVIGKTAEDLEIFSDEKQYGQMVASIRTAGRQTGEELLCRIKSGEIRTCRFTSAIIVMEGRPHVLSTIQDITGQKAAESAVHALVSGMAGTTGLESLDRIAESISGWLGADCVMIGEIQPDGSTVRVLSMLLDGQKIPDYTYSVKGTPCENTARKGFCLYADNVAGAFPHSPDLEKFSIRGYAGTPLFNRDRKVIGILCVMTRGPLSVSQSQKEIFTIIAVKAAAEIERSQLEQSLRRSRQQLQAAMDIAQVVSWEFIGETGMFLFNDRFYAMYGTTAEREGGYLMPAEIYAREFLLPEERGLVAEELRRVRQAGQKTTHQDLEHRIRRRDGQIRYVQIRYEITRDAQGVPTGGKGVSQDIT
ncbi:MAG: PAS domain S-box protein, partial [Methanomicrobiales archaeon]|nr:PAS domain S-box protein [Methanomicrobiales archaeon]